jgi:MFS family permease
LSGADWRRTLWPGIAALVAVMGIGRFVYTPILPEMLASGALTLRGAGWVAAANFVGYLLGALAAAAVQGRLARSRLARAGLLITVATMAAMALPGGVGSWMALRCLAGAASAFALVAVSNQVLERMSAIGAADRTIWLYSGVGLGIVLSAVVVQAVTAAGGGWSQAWTVSAVLSAGFAVVAWRATGVAGVGAASAASSAGAAAPPESMAGAGPAPGSPPAPIPPAAGAPRAYLAAVAAYGLFGLGYVIHATYLPAMVRAAGGSAASAAWIWVLVGVASLPAIALWRAVARRYGTRAAIVGCYAFEGATALVPIFGEGSLVAAAIAAIGLGASFIPVTGLALPFARGLDAARGARAIGVMTAAFGAGQIVGPIAAADLAQRFGFGGPSLLSCAVLLAAAVIMAPRRDASR